MRDVLAFRSESSMVIETLSYLLHSRQRTFRSLYRSIVSLLYEKASLIHRQRRIPGCNVSFWSHNRLVVRNTHRSHFGLETTLSFRHNYFDQVDSVGFDFVNAKMVHLFFVVVVIGHFVVVVWKQKQVLFGIRVPNLDPLQQQQQVVQQWVVVLMAQVVG